MNSKLNSRNCLRSQEEFCKIDPSANGTTTYELKKTLKAVGKPLV
jgi:hypothetical protein